MFSSLRARLWLTYALHISAALALAFFLLLVAIVRSPLLYRGQVERLELAAEVARARYTAARSAAFWQRLSAELNVRLLILSADGQPRFDSQAAAPDLLGLAHLPQDSRLPLLRDAAGKRWLFAVRPLPAGERVLVAVPRPAPTTLMRLVGDDLRAPFVRVGIFSLLLSLGTAWLTARSVADPLQGMVQAARTVPEQLPAPLPEQGPREVREVIRAFNRMAARVQASQQAQRDFVANVSHELKSPLTAIRGFAQALLDGTASQPADQLQAAEVIARESDRMHRLVLNLLDLARLDAGLLPFENQPLDLATLLRATVEKFSPQAQAAEVQLFLDVGALPPLTGDGDRLAQVFTNLLDNAIQHTPPQGQVRVRAVALPDGVQVQVEDTGEGIPAEVLPHIFERFYRGDAARTYRSRQRVGLGLAIAREIVLAHGGKISVHSLPGAGSTFTVFLPFSPTPLEK